MKKSTTILGISLLIAMLLVPTMTKADVMVQSPDGSVFAVIQDRFKNDVKIDVCASWVKADQTKDIQIMFTIQNLGISFDRYDMSHPTLENIGQITSSAVSYDMLAGKKSHCENAYSECRMSFSNPANQNLILCLRVYNDGVAYRYEIPSLSGAQLKDEFTTITVDKAANRWLQSYDPGYERYFPCQAAGDVKKGQWGYPALFEFPKDCWALISEANIEYMQSGSWLNNSKNENEYKVVPGENKLAIDGKWHTPWRVCMVGSLADIVASTLVEDVSEPSKIADTRWIRPGVVSWVYWAYNHGSKDYQIVKQYIDMGKTLKLPYVLIDWEWDVMGNGGDIDDCLAYAKKQGVKCLLWYNSSTAWITDANGPQFRLNTPENREKEFAMLEAKGVAGVKIDFFDGDKEETMRYCQDILESAARHHLLVNFHGATLPRGWRRTYPNLMSTEGVLGAEWYNNNPQLTNNAPWHNATLPFTRNVVGPMDYTPCTFTDSQHPHITSDGHELALPVLFESALQHLADKPEGYLRQRPEVQKFLGQLPSRWDDTRLLLGYPGKYVVMARRCGKAWYVAGINGTNEPLQVNLDWSFLGKSANVTMFLDLNPRDGNYTNVKGRGFDVQTVKVKAKSRQTVNMIPRGGFVMVAR